MSIIEADACGSRPAPPLADVLETRHDHLISGNTPAAQASSVAPGKPLRVLIVEDEALIAYVLAEILEEMGFAVCATEATEAGAVTAALQYQPDLMIVDARLREGSGISAVETILRNQFVPHVFVSGDRLTSLALHPRAIVLQKPFLEADLARAIQRALGPGPT